MENIIQSDASILSSFDFIELGKIKKTSESIKFVAYFWCLATTFYVCVLFYSIANSKSSEGIIFLLVFLAFTSGTVAFGLVHREWWGRIVGIIGSCFILLGFPIGTLAGAVGLINLGGAERLFGANAWSHEDIIKEYNLKQP